jgi:glutamate-1-semialdehyde 2,1-aminomutase
VAPGTPLTAPLGSLRHTGGVTSDPIDAALAAAEQRYVDRRPRTRELHERASAVMPGGNTRTVLYHRPFPIRVAHAWDGCLEDVDGHTYVDLLGNFSAGLYGHSQPAIAEAVATALADGVGPGTHTAHEVAMAEAVCERFPTIERVRFTNSGTEANLMALSAARVVTGRERILAFRGAYHGGLLTFPDGPSPVNAPYDVIVAPYNDPAAARRLLERHADTIAAVLVEPMLGAGGCVPGEPAFLRTLRQLTAEIDALLVVDEVMTSRIGRHGLQERLGIVADLTTLGKYLGGGFSFGAFGGRADVMGVFDPGRPGALPHAGTFNNNLASMVAGRVGLTEIYPPEVAERLTARGDRLRQRLNDVFADAAVPFQVTGVGSLMNVHATRAPIRTIEDVARSDPRRKRLLLLDLLDAGYYVAARGYLALSLAVTDEQLGGFVAAVERIVSERAAVLTP